MPLTVSEVAQILAETSKGQAALVERIRHWTREGLLEPRGEKNPGTGRHREYENAVVVEVAVLDALADLGMQVGQQHTVLKHVRRLLGDGHKIQEWLEKSTYGGAVYLRIAGLGGENPWVQEIHAKIDHVDGAVEMHSLKLYAPHSDATVLLNMSRIIRKIIGTIEKIEKIDTEKELNAGPASQKRTWRFWVF
jgi:DNA-binding transcriptional MerR regulator